MVKNTPLEINLPLLLDPISGQKPCGESLRYTDVYDQIREARREEDDKLPQGVWKSEVKKADWEQVNCLCQEALKNKSKDLQIAAWLTESWLHLDGINGLTQGLELILELTRNYWSEIFPEIDKNGHELRIVPYEWINTRLSEHVQYIRISTPSDRSVLPYSFLDYNEANRREISLKRNPSPSSGDEKSLSQAKVSLSIDQTPTAFYRHTAESCILSLKIMTELEETLRLQLGTDAPAFYRLREKVDALHRFAYHILDERGEKQDPKKSTLEEESLVKPKRRAAFGPIESREQAYSLLSEVAFYLERMEPHSPTPYLIRRAIAWGGMTLSEVVTDTLHNGKDMSLLLDILNVKKEG